MQSLPVDSLLNRMNLKQELRGNEEGVLLKEHKSAAPAVLRHCENFGNPVRTIKIQLVVNIEMQ